MDYNSPFVKQNRLQIFKGVKRSVTFSMGQNVPNKPVVKRRGKKPYKIILPWSVTKIYLKYYMSFRDKIILYTQLFLPHVIFPLLHLQTVLPVLNYSTAVYKERSF